jgi:nucleotide-binding universal stress UspA family protein
MKQKGLVMNVRMPLPIVVGVDGTDSSLQAVRYGVQEALRAGCALRLVHAMPQDVPMPRMLPSMTGDTFEEVGHRVVSHARQLAYDLTDGRLMVETVVRPGSRKHVLREESQNGCLVVVGHRQRSLRGQVFTGSTTSGVAAHASCPVVAVPAGWKGGDAYGRVVVGVEDVHYARDPLALGFVRAAARHARLTVLHAWQLQSPYSDILADRIDRDRWVETTTWAINEVLEEWREAYPNVVTEVDVRHDFAIPALVAVSEHADLMVLGRHGHGVLVDFHLGSVARSTIGQSYCPVEIPPPEWSRNVPSRTGVSGHHVSAEA